MDSDNSGTRICPLLLRILILNPLLPLLLTYNVCPRGQPTPDPPPYPLTYSLSPHGIIRSTGRPPYLSQHAENTLSCTGSSDHLIVDRLHRLHPPLHHPLISESISSSHHSPPSRLPDSRRFHTLAATKMFSKVALICWLSSA